MLKRYATLPGLRLGFKALAVAGVLLTGLAATAAIAAPDSAIIVDSKSGKVLFASNADSPRYPASLTKMMTLYLLFEAIDSGKTSLDARIVASAAAAGQAPSKLGLRPGQTISVRDAILAIVTKSANDVAVAIAEHVGGSEKSFAVMMTKRAHDIGMARTTFRNASGLPNASQKTTARDMATLGRALRDHFPQYYSYFSTPSFVWNGRRISNHNRLLGRIDGVNGIKTGYTRASGFNLVTSVDRSRRMIVGVVMGGETGRQRDKRMVSLIDTYMPLASRGARTANAIPGAPVLDVANVQVKVASAALPMPRPRPPEANAVTIASVASAAGATDAVADADAVSGVSIAADIMGANSVFALDAEQPEGDTAVADEAADAAPAVIKPKGWRIQIAASPSQSSAEDLLDRALAKAGKVLAHASPYTEPVKSGDGTLYRARFAGFTSKESARAACDYLAKQKFSCLAIAN